MSGSPRGTISFTLNGRAVEAPPADRLLDLLRESLGFTGTKEGCGEGECGACCVLLDGLPVNSCIVPTFQVQGREVRTVEGIDPASLLPLLHAGATQCGACTPGVVMAAAWIRENSGVLRDYTLRELMAGNLCRCTGYEGIISGVRACLQPETGA
ncbi:MAG: 2Fe-2S iron-sulfur cluster binding domain-containing protein [Phycisphaerae bacterium]|nr:2Fe-2S iron-sulfur cluster binding domain-containing protein [Phycisphaerae bacterium]